MLVQSSAFKLLNLKKSSRVVLIFSILILCTTEKTTASNIHGSKIPSALSNSVNNLGNVDMEIVNALTNKQIDPSSQRSSNNNSPIEEQTIKRRRAILLPLAIRPLAQGSPTRTGRASDGPPFWDKEVEEFFENKLTSTNHRN